MAGTSELFNFGPEIPGDRMGEAWAIGSTALHYLPRTLDAALTGEVIGGETYADAIMPPDAAATAFPQERKASDVAASQLAIEKGQQDAALRAANKREDTIAKGGEGKGSSEKPQQT